jgi:hypothetical protein
MQRRGHSTAQRGKLLLGRGFPHLNLNLNHLDVQHHKHCIGTGYVTGRPPLWAVGCPTMAAAASASRLLPSLLLLLLDLLCKRAGGSQVGADHAGLHLQQQGRF